MFSKRKPNTKSCRKTTAEVRKKDVHRTCNGWEKEVRFLRQPEELPRPQKPARQGKGALLLQYVIYGFFCFRGGVTIPINLSKAWVCLLGQ